MKISAIRGYKNIFLAKIMITEIVIEYFFSFGQSTSIVLNPDTNILVGINGSGKSNFMKAIQLLYEGVVGKEGIESLINKKWGGFMSFVNCADTQVETIKIKYEFDRQIVGSVLNGKGHNFPKNPIYEIEIHKLGASNYYFSEHIYNESTNALPHPFTYLKVNNGRGAISTKLGKNIGIQQAIYKENELVLRQISEPDRFYPLFTLQKAIEEIVVYAYFDTTNESKIRQLSAYYSEQKLLPNGENLSHLLNYLNGNHINAYDTIISLLQNVNTQFRDLVFSQPTGSKTLLALKEKNLERAITVEHISDGTLRFLLLLSILYNPNRGKVICLDEPEIGLHPDMIQTIGEGIKYAAKHGTQMIVATHSPLLLNCFELEDLRIFEKNENNITSVSSKSEEDFAEWEGEFLVGQMWLRGQIGGVRW